MKEAETKVIGPKITYPFKDLQVLEPCVYLYRNNNPPLGDPIAVAQVQIEVASITGLLLAYNRAPEAGAATPLGKVRYVQSTLEGTYAIEEAPVSLATVFDVKSQKELEQLCRERLKFRLGGGDFFLECIPPDLGPIADWIKETSDRFVNCQLFTVSRSQKTLDKNVLLPGRITSLRRVGVTAVNL